MKKTIRKTDYNTLEVIEPSTVSMDTVQSTFLKHNEYTVCFMKTLGEYMAICFKYQGCIESSEVSLSRRASPEVSLPRRASPEVSLPRRVSSEVFTNRLCQEVSGDKEYLKGEVAHIINYYDTLISPFSIDPEPQTTLHLNDEIAPFIKVTEHGILAIDKKFVFMNPFPVEEEPLALPDYNTWTVVSLKAELRSKGLPVSGNKSELIQRLTSVLTT